jgi:hypothetical protein
MNLQEELLTIKAASEWASEYTGRQITTSNISYLIQYGRIPKISKNGTVFVSKSDLIRYYSENGNQREHEWKRKLGSDLNWALSFEGVKESERTKHVHRLHPYKGKFIPQLVEYFLDSHIDNFKRKVYFRPGDIVLDPFCGSGTTLVQANELGIHAVGIDISFYNALISNVKVKEHNLSELSAQIYKLSQKYRVYLMNSNHLTFEEELKTALSEYNALYFPSPLFKQRVRSGEINQDEYGQSKEEEFRTIFQRIAQKYNVELSTNEHGSFLERWYLPSTRKELLFLRDEINQIGDADLRYVLYVILSRTARSCRATTHSDLATLIDPVTGPYYCQKHAKICAPLFSASKWWNFYTRDTLSRLWQFKRVRTSTYQHCLVGDSRTINLLELLQKEHPALAEMIQHRKIRGIFTSPPYVGMINYHEQHEYAYELFGFERRDELEIGPLYKGQGIEARNEYVESISLVLRNIRVYLDEDFDIFIVANDKFGLYPTIAERSGMRIVNEYKRPVLNRTEKNKDPYSESIFHLKSL